MKDLGKINSVITIPVTDDNFFIYWLNFLRPFHNLTDKEITVFASILKHRWKLSKKISDSDLLDEVTLNETGRKSIREELQLSSTYFQVILSKLKKHKIINEDKINPRYIPRIQEENGNYKLLLIFNFIEQNKE